MIRIKAVDDGLSLVGRDSAVEYEIRDLCSQ